MHEFTNEEISKIINEWTNQLNKLTHKIEPMPKRYHLYENNDEIIGQKLDTLA